MKRKVLLAAGAVLMVIALVISGRLGLWGRNEKEEEKTGKEMEVQTAVAKEESPKEEAKEKAGFQSISMEEAKIYLEEEGNIVLDVRTLQEYQEGHIKGAVNFPNEEIEERKADREKFLPKKDARILVYCRSGNRSKQAAQKLVDLGYTDVIEIGGIKDWTGKIVKE